MTAKDGGAAFPFDERHDNGALYRQEPGMTMRQFYKAHALAGLARNMSAFSTEAREAAAREAAEYAGRLADAMLAEDAAPTVDGALHG